MRRLVLLLALVAVASGCGADGGETRTGEPATASVTAATEETTSSTQPSSTTTTQNPDEVVAANSPLTAATAVLTADGTPGQACDRYVTESFIETAYGGKANCIASRTSKALARKVSLDEVTETHLVAIPEGGPYDGAKVEVDLVRDGDTYRVDSLRAHVPAGP